MLVEVYVKDRTQAGSQDRTRFEPLTLRLLEGRLSWGITLNVLLE